MLVFRVSTRELQFLVVGFALGWALSPFVTTNTQNGILAVCGLIFSVLSFCRLWASLS